MNNTVEGTDSRITEAEETKRSIIPQVEQRTHYRKLNSLKKQKVISLMEGQDKTPEKQLNEMEIGNLPEKEFRIMIVKMIQDLRKTMKKTQEMFTKYLQELNNKQIWIIH